MRSLVALLILVATTGAAKPLHHFTLASDHSSADAKVPFMGLARAKATFPKMNGEISIWPDRPDAFEFHVTVDATAIRASSAMMTRTLKGHQFFDVGKYPEITFDGTKFDFTGDSTAVVTGDLTARGVTRQIQMSVKFESPPMLNDGRTPIDFAATARIDRRKFGMNAYPLIVGSFVKLVINAQMRPG